MMWSGVLLLMLHWFSCVWAMEAVIAGSLRSPELTAYLAATNATTSATTAGGCVSGVSDCLADCEVDALVRLEVDSSREWVLNSENWICRAVRSGVISHDALQKDPFAVYMVPLSNMGFSAHAHTIYTRA